MPIRIMVNNMTNSEITYFAREWSFDANKCRKTLYEISKVENPHPNGKTHCLENKRAGQKLAICFDEVIAEWTNLKELRTQSKAMPHRIDGCYVKDEDIFLIEFKADGDWNGLKDVLWAKFHDSYSLLLDRKIINIDKAKAHLYYIVVSSTRQKFSKEDITNACSEAKKAEIFCAFNNPMSDYMQRPWKYHEILPKADLHTITAFSCRAVYTLDTMQFDRYVSDSQWT